MDNNKNIPRPFKAKVKETTKVITIVGTQNDMFIAADQHGVLEQYLAADIIFIELI